VTDAVLGPGFRAGPSAGIVHLGVPRKRWLTLEQVSTFRKLVRGETL
jgi:hypothetical protein